MVLGLVSDTHGWLHPRLVAALEGVDAIVHAGDVGRPEILDALETVAPVHAVFGNVDGASVRARCREWERFDADGLSVLVTHIAGRPGRWDATVREVLRRERPGLFVCGHSHILQIERTDDPAPMLFVNPGAAGREGFHRVKTCVRLVVEAGRATRADVVHLDEDDLAGAAPTFGGSEP
jgi:putative phosphoesterase